MTAKEFLKELEQKKRKFDTLIRRKIPVKVGSMAKAHFQDNFRKGGFVDGGLHEWPKTRRQLSGSKSARANYGALMSGGKHLFSSVKYTPSDYRVSISNDLQYAPVHNWGGTVSPTVTDKMRRFAWAQHYKEAGKDKAKDTMWKRLALTKKSRLNISIPQRKFLDYGKELEDRVKTVCDTEVSKIIKS